MATSNVLTLIRQFVAETFGTFFLTAVAGVLLLAHFGNVGGYQSVFIPAAIGALILVMVYLLGPVSGAHLNPAVSLSLLIFQKLKPAQFVSDIIAQLFGAWLGSRFVIELVGVAVAKPSFVDRPVMLAEFIGTMLLVFAVTSVVIGRVEAALSGVVIGLALTTALSLAMVTRGGVLNPAVAWAFGATSLVYLVIPFLGGILGAALAIFFGNKHRS